MLKFLEVSVLCLYFERTHESTARVFRAINLHSLLLEAHELLPDGNQSLGEV